MASPSPIPAMTEQRLTIARMGFRGEGVAEGPIYVAGTLPGETVLADVEGERGVLKAIENASPQRIAPFCKHYGNVWRLPVAALGRRRPIASWKADQVVQAFARRGIEIATPELIDAHGEGRRRVSLHVRKTDGVVTAGFMEARSHRLHDLDHCPIVVPALANAAGHGAGHWRRAGRLRRGADGNRCGPRLRRARRAQGGGTRNTPSWRDWRNNWRSRASR